MEFITAKHVALKWGITPNRVTILAKQGRIPGAFQIGTQWMIPEGAVKPADARTRKSKETDSGEFFRFPLYVNFCEKDYYPPLIAEEKKLRKAQLDFFSGKFADAEPELRDLASDTDSIAIRIGALFFLYLCLIENKEGEGAADCLNLMMVTLSKPIPHKKELELFLPWMNCFMECHKFVSQWLNIDPRYNYDSSVHYLAEYLSVYHLFTLDSNKIPSSVLDIYGLTCRSMEQNAHYYEAQELHFVLFVCYLYLGKTEAMELHLKKGLEITYNHDLLLTAAAYEVYYPEEFRKALDTYPADFAKKIRELSRSTYKSRAGFMSKKHYASLYFTLPHAEHKYIGYLSCGYSYKQIADLTGLSVRTVAEHCSKIYTCLGIKNKKELMQIFDKFASGK